MFRLRRGYVWLTLILLSIEIAIAIFVTDKFIRPYLGDLLAALLVYCFIRAFFNQSVAGAATTALCFSVLIEMLQYINIVKMLGLEDSTIPRIAMGHSFDWIDMLMYLIGILLAIGIERFVIDNRASID